MRGRASPSPRAAPRAAERSAPSCWYDRFTAPGKARTTNAVPGGSWVSRSRTRWRSRRRTLLRMTAGPTARGMMKPARAGTSAGSVLARWTTTVPRPARRPARSAAVNCSRLRRRCPAASISGLVSGRESSAPFGPARSENRPSGTGTHAQPEAVGLCAPTVVRLKSALAHCRCLPCCAYASRRARKAR